MQEFTVRRTKTASFDGIGGAVQGTTTLTITGYIDLLSGDKSEYSFAKDSTHILMTKDVNVEIRNSDRIEYKGATYEVTYPDNPTELDNHLEIYLKRIT